MNRAKALLAESRTDEQLLLAIDHIGSKSRQDPVLRDNEADNEHHDDDGIAARINEPLAVTLADWQ